MNRKRIDRIVAGLVFLWALGLYLATVAPTVSFWDPGERIASAYTLQVMHPPGAPFYLLLARLFSMLAPSPETVAYAVNLLSVLASAGTVLLAHLVIVRLVRRWQPDRSEQSTGQYTIGLASGVIGAVAFSVSDSFWFNAGIAEVYALSTFFTALVVWLVLRWSDAARTEEAQLGSGQHLFQLNANRYLVLIAFLFGMAIGVHLLSLLAFFFVALIVFFTEFDQDHWTTRQRWLRIVGAGAISSALFFAIYPGIIVGLPKLFEAVGAPFITALLLALGLGYGVYTTHKRRMSVANLAFMCVTVIFIGYASYALVFVRSATDPPIDMNDPDTIEKFISYLEREQYGSTPLLQGVTYNDQTGRVNRRDGTSTLFPRRHSVDPQHWQVYKRYDSDLEFFLDYQIGYMYLRYFLWNFSGRASDVQGAPWMTGISALDQHVEPASTLQTPSEKESRNVYFALPLLLGLFGAFYHFGRDWRRAFSVFVLFFITGIGIVMYLNQTPMQPRERHYSYVGSFFAFSLWIGIGAGGILQMVYESIQDAFSNTAQMASLLGTGLLVFLAVPGWMTLENYGDHDRSENYVPRDYAHNMLNSVAEDGILFTNGDNDTYPLWYLQTVEGVRQDVRVVNLSLLNTTWYVRQLKNEAAYESAPLPISMSEEQVDKLGYRRWKPKQMKLPVKPAELRPQIAEYLPDTADASTLESPMTWKLEGRPFRQDTRILQTADIVSYNMLRTIAGNGWDRPLYFAVTVARSGQLNLSNYFQLEGQAYRVLPIKHNRPLGRVIPGLTDERMSQFRFTNLADSSVYFNQNARRMIDGYRLHFSHTAEQLNRKGHAETGEQLLTNFTESVPFSTIPADMQTLFFTAQAYRTLGNTEKVARLLERAEPLVLSQLRTAGSRRRFSRALQYAGRIRSSYLKTNQKSATEAFDKKIDEVLANAPFRVPARIRRAYGLSSDTTGGTMAPSGMTPQAPQPSRSGAPRQSPQPSSPPNE
jgi:MFS family permease